MQIKATYKDIWSLAYPIILANFAQNIISLTDIVFLGRVDEIQQGACGLISTYYFIMVTIGLAFSRGGQILIARRSGQQQYEDIGRITLNLLYAQIALATLLFLFLKITSPFVLKLFITSNEIYSASLSYLKYRSYGLFFSFFGFVLMALYTSIGRTRIIAVITAVLCFTNIFLNYVFIFGHYGFPAMGIEGAALASTLSEITAFLFTVGYLLYDKKLIPYSLRRLWKLDFPLQKRMALLSLPLVIQFIVGLGGWFVFLSFIESMGQHELAISVVLKIIYTIFSIPSWGFASAINSVVSNLIGQYKFSQVFLAVMRTAMMSAIFTLALCLILVLFPETLLSLFTKDIAIIEGAKPILGMLVAIVLACSISVIIFNGLMGTGATYTSLVIESITIVIYLSYGYLMSKVYILGLSYVWSAEFIYWVLLAVPAWIFLHSERWKRFEL
ncbi:MAG: MATE family efflux transporter [Sphingobacteriales bacterium]|nr:MAG: MATE family efflux transporter [Sphingobacteriales bacterium]